MPTIARKAKNGITTGGQSASGKSANPGTLASQVPVAMKLPTFGDSMANRLRRLASSGIANHTSVPGCWLCQRASMAANLVG